MEDEVAERIRELKRDAENSRDSIRSKSVDLESEANSAKSWDIFFRSSVAILAVASPALVTYSTTPEVADVFKLGAIILAGVAGAASTLQSVLGFRETYLRKATAALSLNKISLDLTIEMQNAESSASSIDVYADLKNAVKRANEDYTEILQTLKRSLIESHGQ